MTGDGADPAAKAQQPHRPLSRVLIELSETVGERVTLEQLANAFGDRSFGALLVLFAAPNLLPLPPGASTIFGIPLIIVAAQLIIGRPRVWLPAFISRRSIDGATFKTIAHKVEPTLQRFERAIRPRYWPFHRAVADLLVGALALVLAIVLSLPIVFGNWLPSLSIVIISLALMERDGLWLAAGVAVAIAAVAVVGAVVGGLAVAAVHFLF